jgi:serine/threonine protein kinase
VNNFGHALIADLGMSTVVNDMIRANAPTNAPLTHSTNHSVRWMAPELLNSEPNFARLTQGSDMYAFGVVIAEVIFNDLSSVGSRFSRVLQIFTGKLPLPEYNDASVLHMVLGGARPIRNRQHAMGIGLSSTLWEMVQECWETDPTQRPTISDVRERLEWALPVYSPSTSASSTTSTSPSPVIIMPPNPNPVSFAPARNVGSRFLVRSATAPTGYGSISSSDSVNRHESQVPPGNGKIEDQSLEPKPADLFDRAPLDGNMLSSDDSSDDTSRHTNSKGVLPGLCNCLLCCR